MTSNKRKRYKKKSRKERESEKYEMKCLYHLAAYRKHGNRRKDIETEADGEGK